MDNYEKAFYDHHGDKNKSPIRSALEFVLWVEHVDPDEKEMATMFRLLPDTEQQRLKNATKRVKQLAQGNQKND
jgi:predicted ATPase